VEEVQPFRWWEARMQRGLTVHERARGRSDGSATLPSWSGSKKQLQEKQVREQEEQPWRQRAEVVTCKCNQAEE
jgi:hypothetical protein